jgi:hypothetical protein
MRKNLATLVVVLGLGPLVGSASANTGGTNLPFKVTGSGSVNENYFYGDLSGGALGAFAGKGSFSGSSFVYSYPSECPDTSTPGDISITLVAANGDTLNTQVAQGAFTVTGGTGRFANATGQGTFTSAYHFPYLPIPGTGDFGFTETGTINLNT